LGGSALWLKDVVFKTRWIKNSKSFLSVPPLPPHAGGTLGSPVAPSSYLELGLEWELELGLGLGLELGLEWELELELELELGLELGLENKKKEVFL